MSVTLRTTVLVLLLLVAGLGHAKIYKWVDEHGKVHFSVLFVIDSAQSMK